ncbi:hypothetical protein [Clostridium sp.]|uniref:hypothetical protein n=1 Tax=Clostridium sp. TaxID=1506 RepID=UPI0032163F85
MITELDMVNIHEGTELWYVTPRHKVVKVVYSGERSKKGKGHSLKFGKKKKPYPMRKLFISKEDADEYAKYRLEIIADRAVKRKLELDKWIEDNMEDLIKAESKLRDLKDSVR